MVTDVNFVNVVNIASFVMFSEQCGGWHGLRVSSARLFEFWVLRARLTKFELLFVDLQRFDPGLQSSWRNAEFGRRP